MTKRIEFTQFTLIAPCIWDVKLSKTVKLVRKIKLRLQRNIKRLSNK